MITTVHAQQRLRNHGLGALVTWLSALALWLATAAAAQDLAWVSFSPLPAAQVGSTYTYELEASGGQAPYTFTLVSGALPTGLQLSGAGVLSGTATTTGSFSFTLRVQDAQGGSADALFAMEAVRGIRTISLGQPDARLITLGSLASRTQAQSTGSDSTTVPSPLTAGWVTTTTGTAPYTVTGVDSGTGAVYTFQTDALYDGASRTEWRKEGDERALDPNDTQWFRAEYTTFSGREALLLESYGWCLPTNSVWNSFCSMFGPEVWSEPFVADAGESLSFSWAAQGGGDDYESYAFLVNTTTNQHTILAYGRGKTQGWTVASAVIPVDGTYRFRFVNGSYDYTGGRLLGARMYIDPTIITVGATQTITFPELPQQTTSTGANAVVNLTGVVTASSGLPVTLTSSTTNVCTVDGMTVTLRAGGPCRLTADQPGNDLFVPAASVTRSFNVIVLAAQDPVVLTASPSSAVYGDTVTLSVSGGSGTGAVTYSLTEDTACSLDGATITITHGVGACTAIATKASDGTFAQRSSEPVSVAVAPRTITVTADARVKVYAEPSNADPELTWRLTSGSLVSGDAITGALTRTPGEAVGTYAIEQGTLSAGANYALSFVGATFAVQHGPADHLITVAPEGTQTAGLPFDLVSITAVDRYGNIADGANGASAYAGEKTLAYVLSGALDGPSAGVDAFTTAVSFTAGVGTTTLTTTLHRAQVTTVTASDAALPRLAPDVASAVLTVAPATAARLQFSAEPVTTRAAVPFAIAPVIDALDAYGNLATSFTGTIDLTVTGANTALQPPERRTATASAGVATVPCVWIDAPARNVRLMASADGLESGESEPFDVTGVNLVGSIYEDPDASGSRPAAAVGIEGASIRLLGADDTTVAWPNGASFDGVSCTALTATSVLSAADGSFTLRGLDVVSVELVVAGEMLERYVRVEREPLRLDLPSFGTVAGVDVGFFPGAFVEGAVFRDDGAGALAVANDGVRGDVELGRSGVTVTAFVGQQTLPTRSAADGRYRLAVPLVDSAEITVGHDASRATGHTLTVAGEGSTRLAAGSAGDVASFSVSPGAIYELDFGVVPSLRISGGGESVTTSPGSARFVLNLEPGTPSTVRLSASAGSYAWTARLDPSDEVCAAALTALLEPDSGSWRLDGTWPRAANGSLRSCPVEVEVQVPSGEPAGRVHDLLVRASATWQRPAEAPTVVDTSAAQQLRTTVIEGGRVALRFDASVDGGVTYAARVEAAPGTPVRYRVRFDNPSAQVVRDVVVRVPIDAAYARPTGPTVPILQLVCPDATEPAAISALPYDAAVAVVTLDLEETCGLQSLPPGAGGVLSFEVEVR